MIKGLTAVLPALQGVFAELEAMVPPLKVIPFEDSHVVRFTEKQIQQAIVLKLAQYVSSLSASLRLLSSGHIFELGILKRTLDECGEAIQFLSSGLLYGRQPLHDRYLNWFFYDLIVDGLENKPGEIPRRKIRNHMLQSPLSQGTPAGGGAAMDSLMQGFSAYVHGAATALMELVGEDLKLKVTGMPGTARQVEHGVELWSYFFRGTTTMAIACKALGREDLFQALRAISQDMEQHGPEGYVGPP